MEPQTYQRIKKIDEKLEELYYLKKRVDELEEKVDDLKLQVEYLRKIRYSG